MNRALKQIYAELKKSIQNIVYDLSFLIMIIITFGVNYWVFDRADLFQDGMRSTIAYQSYTLLAVIIMIYSGYIGAKFFAREFDKKTISALFVEKSNRTSVYFGKALSGVGIVGFLHLISFLHIYFAFLYYGKVSQLMAVWIFKYTIISLIACLVIFFLSVNLSILFKKELPTILVTSIWSVISFFSMIFIPEFPEFGDRMYVLVLLFPFSAIQYAEEYILQFGALDNIIILIPSVIVIWLLGISIMLFKGVKI